MSQDAGNSWESLVIDVVLVSEPEVVLIEGVLLETNSECVQLDALVGDLNLVGGCQVANGLVDIKSH